MTPGEPLQQPKPVGALGLLAASWGMAGTAALLLRAICALASASEDALRSHPLAGWHWGLAGGWIAFMCYFQGYRGFQRGFSRRAVARAFHLARHPRLGDVVLAPLFCVGLIRATPRRLRTNRLVLAVMLALVVVVRLVPQPYRGLIDAGVGAGLVWGLVALAVQGIRAAFGSHPGAELDLPSSSSAPS